MTRTRPVQRKIFLFLVATLGVITLALFRVELAEAFSLSGPQSTMVSAGPVAKAQWDLFMVTVYVTTFIFIVVGSVLAYAQIKFRAKSEAEERAVPPQQQGHGNPFIEIGLIASSVFLLVLIAIPTLRDIWYTHDVPEAERANAMDITATGYQWWFKFEYPGDMVKLPTGGEAPLVTGNELVVPAGVPVRIHLRTIDVIHSFWVPKLAGKVDMIPNRPNFLWLKADKPGYFYGQCAEYCGESHAIMRFRVIALSPSEYVRWLDNQKNGARTATAATVAAAQQATKVEFASFTNTSPRSSLSASGEMETDPFGAWRKKQQVPAHEEPKLIAEGHQLFSDKTCMNCHTIRGHASKTGTPYGGITAPDLTHVGARSTIAAGVLENTPERMSQWLNDPEYFKPGNKMVHGIGGMAGYFKPDEHGNPVRNINLNNREINALVAYLQSLK